jgi:hypothetical protein
MNTQHIAFLVPGMVGVVVILCTLLIHALPLNTTVKFVRHQKRLGRVGVGFWMDTGIITRTMSYALVAHLFTTALWAILFMICGEFSDFGTAFYHSAVNYTSLGYGDIVMSPHWRLLGPLETANGLLLFGISTATIFAVIQQLVEARRSDSQGS